MSVGRMQLCLGLIVAAAAVVMLGLFSPAVRISCLAVLVAATWLIEPERSGPGGGWWLVVAAGVLASLAGFTVSELSEQAETVAGIVAIAGAALVIVGAAIGFPRR